MISTLLNSIERTANTARTLNNAKSNASTLNDVLDLFTRGGAARNCSSQEVEDLFAKAFAEDKLLALKTIFYLRDIRGGQGERKTFRRAMQYLARNFPNVVRKNLDSFIFFGRWDDLLCLHNTSVWEDVITLIRAQVGIDLEHLSYADKPVSMLGKWLPSINTSNNHKRLLAKNICKELRYSYKDYRKMLSKLRERIKVVERDMCSKKWSDIDYEKLPSRANLIYTNAFIRNDKVRYGEYLEAVTKGDAKINAGTLYPYDIVREILTGKAKEAHTQLWEALPNYLKDNEHKGLCVVDVSDSMNNTCNSNHGVRPIDVSISLGLYIAEHNNDETFGNSFITFSEEPTLERVKGDNIVSKVHHLKQSKWGYNTDLQSVFDLILDEATKNNLTNNDLPDVVYIISDMEFDVATSGHDFRVEKTNLETIQHKYKAAGYIVPKIVFWNVDSKAKQTPVTVDDRGVCMVSGCSPSILESLLTGKIVSPMQVLYDTVDVERYRRITV